MFLVEYMLRGVDHMPVSMEWPTREKMQQEVERISKYPDLIYLYVKELLA